MRRRLWRITGWLVLAVALLVLFGASWCGALALRIAQWPLRKSGVTLAGAAMRVGVTQARAEAVFLTADGWSAQVEGGRVDYSPAGLCQQRVGAMFARKVVVSLGDKGDAADNTAPRPTPAQIMCQWARVVGAWRVERIAVAAVEVRQSGRAIWRADGVVFGELRGGEACFAVSPWRWTAPAALEMGGAAHLTLKLADEDAAGQCDAGGARAWQAMQGRLVVDGRVVQGAVTNMAEVAVECRALWPRGGEGGSVTGNVSVVSRVANPMVPAVSASGTWSVDGNDSGVRTALALQAEPVSGVFGEVAASDASLGFAVSTVIPRHAAEMRWHVGGTVSVPRLATTNGVAVAEGLLLSTTLAGAGGMVAEVALPVFSWRKLEVLGSPWKISHVAGAVSGEVVRVTADVALQESPLQASMVAEIPWRTPQAARLLVDVPAVLLELGGPVARELEEKADMHVDGGSVEARAEVMMAHGMPRVSGTARVRNLEMHGRAGPDKLPWALSGAGVALEFVGTADGAWNADGRVSARHLAFDRLVATNLYAQWRANQEELFVERAQLGWCAGQVQAFALRANAKTASADVTLFIDQVELGEILGVLRAIPGNGQGQLHGRLQVRYRDDQLRLGRGYLYSLPGEGGRVQVTDTAMVEAALQGIDPHVRKQVSTALHDMAFSVFRLDFDPPPRRSEEALLKLKLVGQADKRKDLPPVNLDVNMRGPLNALFNMGVKLGK